MKVLINGEAHDLPDRQNLADLVKSFGFASGRGVAVAVDGEVVSRSEWETTLVREGQKIEIVRAVQGG